MTNEENAEHPFPPEKREKTRTAAFFLANYRLYRIFVVLLWDNWETMASELHDRLERLQRKSAVLIEKYQALLAQSQQTTRELEESIASNARLKAQIEHLEHENEYLRLSHTVAPTAESVAQTRAIISKLVRDIDRCISQLNT